MRIAVGTRKRLFYSDHFFQEYAAFSLERKDGGRDGID